jgi:tetratricopeptide (TPR) repeat protein
MNLARFSPFIRAAVTIVAALLLGSATAQEDAGDVPETVDEAITVLDQVVPVAEDDATLQAGEEAPEEEPSDQELLLATFDRFKDLYGRGIHDEAENVAKRLVELAIRVSGPASDDAAKALTNLAIVQMQLGNYEASQQNFATAIEVVEENEDMLSGGLINPLKGLGKAQLESGRPDLAVGTYNRAVHITHVNEGPHNLGQIELLEALAETNLQLGMLDEARDNHDMIYSLNLRYYDENAYELVPSLMRRARWQRRTGYVFDERATYRRVIRILEKFNGDDDISLVVPLMKLGQSYLHIDTSDSRTLLSTTAGSGELYYKRAVRIASEHPDSSWKILADANIALGDYYNLRSDVSRSIKVYEEAWEMLSTDDERLDYRRQKLESLVRLGGMSIPEYTGGADRQARASGDPNLREGRVLVSYDVTHRGRVANLRIVESTPPEFGDMARMVQREIRSRIFRMRFDDAKAVPTSDRAYTHTFYYLQDELERLREEAEQS